MASAVAKRALRQDPEQFRGRARSAAVRLFARHGFEGTSVQAIADELGVSKQALLYHFSSKEGLRQAALEEMVAMWRQALPRVLAALTRPQTPVEDALVELVEFSRLEPAYARFLMHELLQPSDARHPALADVEPWLKLAADYIRGAQSEGKIDSTVDPEAWVVNFGTLIVATLSVLDERSGPRKPSPARIIRELARMARVSLLGKPAV